MFAKSKFVLTFSIVSKELINLSTLLFKVRRSAAKCLSAVLGSRPELLSEFYKTVSLALIGRFKGTACIDLKHIAR